MDDMMNREDEREKIEIELMLDGIHRFYGFDFRNYAYSSLRRRIWHRIHTEKLQTVSALQERILHDRGALERLLSDLSIPVTEMFRNPTMFRWFREHLIPILRNYPYLRIWHAGCSTGEEVYSMAIMLHEEGLYDRTRIYATDMNQFSLDKAKEGLFPLEKMKDYTKNYMDAGGTQSFSEYYTAKYNSVIFQPFLKKNIIFAEHNLATDRSFNEFQVIFCRNVMIYFDKVLQDRVHRLFYESLAMDGVLALGNKESINFTAHMAQYEVLSDKEKLYRKVR
ncbi:chemotaxis protein CheR [Paenibacillus swuensis]|uniref:Chemotaxis protein CheR n=1 Tax=Paenibacillus swuensis TaxID=1178515 RepID=A0A172TM45_9BACL|nr:protein-glutamate O-methyltransferase CheR [Paenibacillus swuensis]ANE48111.1 chemotaxis protein CheR [Paenibacillus swuensis]